MYIAVIAGSALVISGVAMMRLRYKQDRTPRWRLGVVVALEVLAVLLLFFGKRIG